MIKNIINRIHYQSLFVHLGIPMKLVKESLFSSTIRSFCISFFAVFGIVIAFFVVMLIFGAGKNSKAMDASMYDVIIPDTNSRKYTFATNKPLLLRININGEIGKANLDIGSIRSILSESRSGPFKTHPIKGILLYINSPGGAATDSESIYYAIKDYALKFQTPVYAYVEGLCASGGMMIACSADKIYSSESSIIGSVGVIFSFFNFYDGMQKIGVQNKNITAGTDKDAMSPFQPLTDEGTTSYQRMVDLNYNQFVSIVSSARPKLTKSLLKDKYGAHCFYSSEAEEYGYIDGAGYQYKETVQMLAQAAEIDGENYQVVQLQPKIHLSDIFTMGNSLVGNPEKRSWFKTNPLLWITPNKEQLMNLYRSCHNE